MSFATGLKTIVVATDLHGQSEAALEYARKLATHYGARIVLAHGTDPMEYAAVGTVPDAVLQGVSEGARAELERMTSALVRAGIYSHSEVRQGTVALMLVDVARQYDAGLIVIGTKGHEGAGPIAVGAIAEQLVRLSPCPVMAVAADWNAGPFRPTPGGPVMLAMEHNESTGEAVADAESLARTFNRPLILVHAAGEPGSDPCATMAEEYGIEATEDLTVHCIAKKGAPVEAIGEAIAQYHPCILVAGVKRASETPGPHGTAFQLLASSRVPVLCVPPGLAGGV
jgi:nucleotide-binding universal stress UspA family protein